MCNVEAKTELQAVSRVSPVRYMILAVFGVSFILTYPRVSGGDIVVIVGQGFMPCSLANLPLWRDKFQFALQSGRKREAIYVQKNGCSVFFSLSSRQFPVE